MPYVETLKMGSKVVEFIFGTGVQTNEQQHDQQHDQQNKKEITESGDQQVPSQNIDPIEIESDDSSVQVNASVRDY